MSDFFPVLISAASAWARDRSGLTHGSAGLCLGADETGSRAGPRVHNVAGCGCRALFAGHRCSLTEPRQSKELALELGPHCTHPGDSDSAPPAPAPAWSVGRDGCDSCPGLGGSVSCFGCCFCCASWEWCPWLWGRAWVGRAPRPWWGEGVAGPN